MLSRKAGHYFEQHFYSRSAIGLLVGHFWLLGLCGKLRPFQNRTTEQPWLNM
jgi:hypothetical protein